MNPSVFVGGWGVSCNGANDGTAHADVSGGTGASNPDNISYFGFFILFYELFHAWTMSTHFSK